jgi:glycosyltransferase involved in cell wall biosynthesis
MPARSLHIAWLGPGLGEDGGVPGVCTELVHGLARLGHRIDVFLPTAGHPLPARVAGDDNVAIVWGTDRWQWQRWYSRTRLAAFASGTLSRSLASVRLRSQILRRHRSDPYDVIYQFSSVESLSVPPSLARAVPLVIHPETHSAGELRSLLAERQLSIGCQGLPRFALVAAIMATRTLTQRGRIRRARLLVCISSVFRDHLVRDYGFPLADTVVIPNPIRIARFSPMDRPPAQPPVVLVLGRVVARKGIDSVVAVAKALREREADVRIRVVGGPSLWSDYTKLLEDLPPEVAEYAGSVDPDEVPTELARCDALLAPSTYEPFALTVAEALASGLPVIATSEVGAIEDVQRSVVAEVRPGDVGGMVDAIVAMLARLRDDPAGVRSTARAEAERLFAPEVVCEQLSHALQRLVDGVGEAAHAQAASGAQAPS